MHLSLLTPILLSLSTLAHAATPMSIEVYEENGKTVVREVPGTSLANVDAAFCTNCVHVGGRCNIGEGNCYASEKASCTYCGGACKICVREGITCEAYC
ncbi:hypothetical protein QBC39DRAFT_369570 [Podospora conica]|nr:hypothetical protein QBC39DRAFT_369570 [Schizothecium conicum]